MEIIISIFLGLFIIITGLFYLFFAIKNHDVEDMEREG